MEQRDFALLQELVKCLSGVDVMLPDNRREIAGAILSHLPADLYHTRLTQELETGISRVQPGCVCEIRGIFDLHYLMVFDPEEDRCLIAGPCLLKKPDAAELRAQARTLGLGSERLESLLPFCLHLPQVTYDVFHRLGTLLARWLLPEAGDLPHQKLDYQWDSQARTMLFLPDQYAELTQMRRVEQRYENSTALTEAVKCGNLSLAYRFMQTMSGEQDALVRNPDPLRNRKNMCIVLNTQLRHALESVGIHPYILDRTSGQIALRIEQLHTLEESERFTIDVIRQYCELAQEHSYAELKPFSLLAVTYIKNHLNETLTVKDTARALLVNPDYLSNRFHKEVGMTFIDFVNRERTVQAANLLRNTPLQIQQIASAVGYNNTSYFSRQFFRFHGQTPRDFRSGTRQLTRR